MKTILIIIASSLLTASIILGFNAARYGIKNHENRIYGNGFIDGVNSTTNIHAEAIAQARHESYDRGYDTGKRYGLIVASESLKKIHSSDSIHASSMIDYCLSLEPRKFSMMLDEADKIRFGFDAEKVLNEVDKEMEKKFPNLK